MSLLLEEKDALLAHKNGTKSDQALLERLYPAFFNRKITDRIQCLDDVYSIMSVDFEGRLRIYNQIPGIDHVIAFDQACLIVQAYNEGWVPNWDDNSEYKWYGYWDHRASGSGFRLSYVSDIYVISSVGSRLVFRTEELARDAYEKFPHIFKLFMTF
jgi:hypothetical protein